MTSMALKLFTLVKSINSWRKRTFTETLQSSIPWRIRDILGFIYSVFVSESISF